MYHLPAYLKIISDFIEDTSVVVTSAYLLARGGILPALFRSQVPRGQALRAGLVLGAVALTEVLFPNERYPYLMDTLATTFAMFTAGPIAALACAGVASTGSLAYAGLHLIGWPDCLMRTSDVFVALAVAGAIRRVSGVPYNGVAAMTAGALAQLAVVLTNHALRLPMEAGRLSWMEIGSVVGNGLGMLMMTKVVNEAWIRISSERNRLAAEHASAQAIKAELANQQALTLAAKAELTALRARIHPHFLYNALGAIAGLCAVAPEEAVEATEQLGDLMRKTLELSNRTSIPVHGEIDRVCTYLGIQQKRYGKRLAVSWKVDDACARMEIPPLSVQTLVENAVIHGMAGINRPVSITIAVRRNAGYVGIAVKDDGRGITPLARQSVQTAPGDAAHGLQILSQQLVIMYGKRSRLRLYRGKPDGTLACFFIPEAIT